MLVDIEPLLVPFSQCDHEPMTKILRTCVLCTGGWKILPHVLSRGLDRPDDPILLQQLTGCP